MSGNGFRIEYEENPRSELTPAGTPSTGPNRISTVSRDFPTTGTSFTPNPTPLDRSDEQRNILGGVAQLEDTFAPSGSHAQRAYIDDLIFLLGLSGFTGTHTVGDGIITDPDTATIPAATHRWQFVRKTGFTPQTARVTALYANEGFFLQGSGFAISDFTLDAAGQYGSTWMGMYLTSISDPSITPTLISSAIPPVRRADLQLTWLSGGATADDFNVANSNGLQLHYSMGANGSYFPDTIEFADAQPSTTGTVPKRTLDADDWNAVIAANTFSAKAKWVQTKVIGATTYTYKMWLEMPSCQITGFTPDPVSANRRRGGQYTYRAAYDASAGYDVRWTLVGAIAAVNTYA